MSDFPDPNAGDEHAYTEAWAGRIRDDAIQIKASEVKVGDVLLWGDEVTDVKDVGFFVKITSERGAIFPKSDSLVAVREVVTD